MEDKDYSKISNFTYVSENASTVYDPEESEKIIRDERKKTIVLACVGVIFIFLSIIFHLFIMVPIINEPDQDKDLLFLYKIIFYTLNGGYLFCGIYLLFNYLAEKYASKESSSFVSLIIRSKGSNIISSVFLFFLYFFIKTYEDILLMKNVAIAIGDDPKLHNIGAGDGTDPLAAAAPIVGFDFKVFLIENFSHIFLGISLVMFIALIKNIIVEGIDYMMYWSSYFQKVIKTNKDIQVLFQINSITGKSMSLRSPDWVRHIFKMISPEGTPFNAGTLEYFFSKEEVEKIMNLFDQRGTGIVDEEHFVSIWLNITNDKREIKNVIEYKNILLQKFDYVVSVLFFPIMIFVFMSILGKTEHFKTYGSLVLGFILPLSFIFGSVIGDLFKSIIFVFFVRPFEVGDTIELEKVIYKVDEIGLLYTSFTRQSLNVSIPNTELMKKNIVNFRRSEIYEKEYKLEFEIDLFKSQVNSLRTHIKDLLAENPTLFKKNFKLQDINVKDSKNLEVTLLIYANLHTYDLTEGIDEFSMRLDQVVKEIKNASNKKELTHEN